MDRIQKIEIKRVTDILFADGHRITILPSETREVYVDMDKIDLITVSKGGGGDD